MKIIELLDFIEDSQIVTIVRHATQEPMFQGIVADCPRPMLHGYYPRKISATYSPSLGREVLTVLVDHTRDLSEPFDRVAKRRTDLYDVIVERNGLIIYGYKKPCATPYKVFYEDNRYEFKTIQEAEDFCNKQETAKEGTV